MCVYTNSLFPRHRVVGLTELTLSASQPKSKVCRHVHVYTHTCTSTSNTHPYPTHHKQLRRLPWTATTGQTLAGATPAGHAPIDTLTIDDADALTRPLDVEVGPMEIRTFEVQLLSSSASESGLGGLEGAEAEAGRWLMME